MRYGKAEGRSTIDQVTSDSGIYDLIIIGAGPGGVTAGIYATRAALKTLIFEKAAPGGQMTISASVENWPGEQQIGGSELAMKFLLHAKSYGLEIRTDEVVALVPGSNFHQVKLYNGETFRSHAVILATGGNSRKVGFPREAEYLGRGVSYCAVCDGFFFHDKKVVVIGGGDSAAEESLYLAKIAKQVYLIHRRDKLKAGAILQQRLLAECKVKIVWNTVVTDVQCHNDKICGVHLRDTVTGEKNYLEADGVFIFIGFEPNNRLVPVGTKMNSEGYVVTDEKCQTNTPGIFVIGDLREKFARQIILSSSDGCIAALAAAHYIESRKASLTC